MKAEEHHPNREAQGWQHHVVGVLCCRRDSNTIIKFANDTTVGGLITDNDETAYREEVRDLAGWFQIITIYP